jgi:hypothetical protein
VNSVVGSESVVDHHLGVILSGHPVTEEEGGEEWDEACVDAEEAWDPNVEGPANDPWFSEKSFNLLYLKSDDSFLSLPYRMFVLF